MEEVHAVTAARTGLRTALDNSAVLRALCWLAGWGVLYVVLDRLYRARYLGYDAAWSVIWGGQLAHGHAPSYQLPFAPTPHPLANLVAAGLELTGQPVGNILLELSIASLALTVVLIFRLGQVLYGPAAGVVAAAVFATRVSIVREAQYASVDIWFLALVVGALCLVRTRPERRWQPLALLCAAGLVRPEAWLLAAGVAALTYGRQPWRAWLVPAGILVAAPALWGLSDLLVTGDPLYSLHGTRALAAQLDRPRSEAVALVALPQYLRYLVGPAVLAVGLLGAVIAVVVFYRRSLALLLTGAIGVATFLALGVLDLPLLDRYLLVPGLVLVVFAGVTVAGWMRAPAGRDRTAWVVAGIAVLGLAVAWDLPRTHTDLQQTAAVTKDREAVQDELRRAFTRPVVRAAYERCPIVKVPDYRAVPQVAEALGTTIKNVRIGTLDPGELGLALSYSQPATQQLFGAGPSAVVQVAPLPAAGAERLQHRRYWILDARCG